MNRTFIDRRASKSEHRRAKDVAQAVLDGRTTVLEGVRALVSLAHTDAIAEVEDRKFIIGIESETDHLPVGGVRELWAPHALKEKMWRLRVPRNGTRLTSWKPAAGLLIAHSMHYERTPASEHRSRMGQPPALRYGWKLQHAISRFARRRSPAPFTAHFSPTKVEDERDSVRLTSLP
jgi:hypothetical protein